jgi:hypothetical protein
MFFDILAVFIVSLISSLFLCTTSVHGLPSSPRNLQLIHKSSSLRLLNHRPVLSIDNDTGGDTSEMLIGESNEDDDDSSLFSLDLPNEPLKYYLQPSSSSSSSSKLLFRKLLQQQQQQQKRSSMPQYNLHSAVTGLADSSNSNRAASLNQLEEPIRLSSSLKTLVETNPFARAWLTMLLQKLMQEQNVPYIFKYGRRRK